MGNHLFRLAGSSRNEILPRLHNRRNMVVGINTERVTVGDCLDNYYYKDKTVLINDGKIINFKTEQKNSTTRRPKQDSAIIRNTHGYFLPLF